MKNSFASFSELYHVNGTNGGYDSLNRLTDFRRGVLSKSSGSSVYDTITTSSGTRSWTLDAQGNWSANPSGSTYAVNQENQYTSIASGTNSLSFGYSADGNMTTRVDHSGFNSNGYVADTFAYDAWDRLASFRDGNRDGNRDAHSLAIICYVVIDPRENRSRGGIAQLGMGFRQPTTTFPH